MSYFYKKPRQGNSSFINPIDESSISNSNDQCLIINSNIFNKSANNHNQKNSYTQSQQNQTKNTSPISYLKNFKKNTSKANQQNVYMEQSKQFLSAAKNGPSLKKEYELMMNELMGIQSPQVNNKSSSKIPSQSRPAKNKTQNDQKISIQKNRDSSAGNNPYLNDQQEQSMQELLNSSINQFERFLEQQQDHSTVDNCQKNQNMALQKTLTKFKSILKQKLEHGLIKQRQEMKNMLNEYVQLITKLLHDKEEMSTHIEELQEQLENKANHIFSLEKKVDEINKEKDEHIQKTKQQIQQFLIIIQQFENQARQENQRYEEIQKEVERLAPFEEQLKQLQSKQSSSHKKYSPQQFEDQQRRIECQSQKIQTLLELLEKSQQQTNSLKEILSKQNTQIVSVRREMAQQSSALKSHNSRSSQGDLCQFTHKQIEQLKVFYEQKLEQLEIQHEEQFIQYEKAIKQTLTKKDECIQRLNSIIAQLRDGNKSASRGKNNQDIKQKGKNQAGKSKYYQQKKAPLMEQLHALSQNTFNEEEIDEQNEQLRF